MKNVYLIQNSNLSFDMNISKIYSPKKYSLFLIVNKFGYQKIMLKHYITLFKKIWEIENFNFNFLKEIILSNQHNNPGSLQIVTNAEEAVIVCGQLCEFFNKARNYDRFIDKIEMKTLLKKNDILTPKYILFDKHTYQTSPLKYLNSIMGKLIFPLIAKPINSMSCIGVEKFHSPNELSTWAEKNKFTDTTYEIDEYIDGTIYNCDSYIQNGKIIFTQVSKSSNSCYDFICGLNKGTITLPHNHSIYKSLCNYTKDVHAAIQIPQGGVTHLEVIVTKENVFYFVEIAYRSPGILIPAMYKKFLNIDTIEAHILLQIDDEYELIINYGPYCAWVAFPTQHGILENTFEPQIESNYTLEWNYHPGQFMPKAAYGRDFAGKILIWNKDYLQLKNDFKFISEHRFFDVGNDHSKIKNSLIQ